MNRQGEATGVREPAGSDEIERRLLFARAVPPPDAPPAPQLLGDGALVFRSS